MTGNPPSAYINMAIELNCSKHIKVYTFLFTINYLLHQFTSMEFTEVINNGDSLTYKTKSI